MDDNSSFGGFLRKTTSHSIASSQVAGEKASLKDIPVRMFHDKRPTHPKSTFRPVLCAAWMPGLLPTAPCSLPASASPTSGCALWACSWPLSPPPLPPTSGSAPTVPRTKKLIRLRSCQCYEKYYVLEHAALGINRGGQPIARPAQMCYLARQYRSMQTMHEATRERDLSYRFEMDQYPRNSSWWSPRPSHEESGEQGKHAVVFKAVNGSIDRSGIIKPPARLGSALSSSEWLLEACASVAPGWTLLRLRSRHRHRSPWFRSRRLPGRTRCSPVAPFAWLAPLRRVRRPTCLPPHVLTPLPALLRSTLRHRSPRRLRCRHLALASARPHPRHQPPGRRPSHQLH